MKKKIVGIFICILLIATMVPVAESQNDSVIAPMVSSDSVQQCTRADRLGIPKLLASDGTLDGHDNFGFSISLDGDTALIGAHYDFYNGIESGSAYVFTRNGTTWTIETKLGSFGVHDNRFGYSVSLDGNTALIGEPGVNSDTGSAYVFTRTGTTWTQEAQLFASDGETGDNFGFFVSLCSDTALIGAVGDDDNGVVSGSVYVFIRTGTTWTQQAKLLAADGAAGDWFGHSISLDGDTALIGASHDDDNGANSGSVYVFTRTDTTWTQQAKLLSSDGVAEDEFGNSVSLDGDTALIGAPDNHSGSAYIFTRTNITWTQHQKLFVSDGGDYRFGCSVSLSGSNALIGAPRNNSAFVFTRNGDTWTQQQILHASEVEGNYFDFGNSVSLNGDTALISAPRFYVPGFTYVFARNGTTWTQQAKLFALSFSKAILFGIISEKNETEKYLILKVPILLGYFSNQKDWALFFSKQLMVSKAEQHGVIGSVFIIGIFEALIVP